MATMTFSNMCASTTVFLLAVLSLQSPVAGQQKFLKTPSNTTAIKSQDIKLECVVQNLQAEMQWVRDGFGMGTGRDLPSFNRYRITGSPERGEYNLFIDNVSLEDDASFQCQVMATTVTPGMRTKTAILTVHLPPNEPEVADGPQVQVVANEPTNLTCEAAFGKPAPTMAWYSDGVEITAPTTYEVTTDKDGKRQNVTGTLTINPRKADQGRHYECHVINQALDNAKWTRVALEVLYPPEVSMTVAPTRHIQEYSQVTLTCEGKGNPNVLTWRWFRETEELVGEISSTLVIAEIERDLHGKSVSCEATNSVGSTRQSYTLNIKYGPRFTAGPEHIPADVGDDAELSCSVDGNPSPHITWSKRDTSKILSSKNKLIIYNVLERDFGVYNCIAFVTGFDEIKMEVHLLKKGPPSIISEPEQAARYGDTGVVECVTASVPKPAQILWEHDGQLLEIATLDRYQVREEDLPGGRRSIIEITSVQDEDYGTYNCTVENGYGRDSLAIKLTKEEVIPLPYILAIVLCVVVVFIVVAVVLYVYHRRQVSAAESYLESSESTMNKPGKKGEDLSPDLKVDYKSNPIDAWRQDIDPKYYRHSAEYDELSYPPPAPPPSQDTRPASAYDYQDGFGNYGYSRDYRNDYGTYPRTAAPDRMYDTRYGSQSVYGPGYPGSEPPVYGGADIPAYRPPPGPRSDYSAPGDLYGQPPMPPIASHSPPPPMASRLSTNV